MGFAGFQTIGQLRQRMLSDFPGSPGVYVVMRDGLDPPQFLERGTGGRFKGRDPNVAIAALEAKWVADAYVLYIGKADAGSSGARGLKKRVGDYLRFGAGAPIGHWGGRYLWQLAETPALRVAWRRSDQPRADEQQLLRTFYQEHRKLPYANLTN
jgi:hypothetical protein